MATEDYDLLIVSDLHLSEGRDHRTKKLSGIEDFLFDEEFARFLHYHMRGLAWRPPDRKWHLIINGDFVDFLQVVSTEVDQECLRYIASIAGEKDPGMRASPEAPQYGFGTGWKETIFKLWKIMDGHWQFFEVLAEFVAAGNVVSIGRGNHDVEFIYPQVRAALFPKLRRIYEAKLKREATPDAERKLADFDASAPSRIRFLDWFYREKELWVEHGNQYDELNSFKYWLAPFLPEQDGVGSEYRGEIDLPWGSFFVRYLFNDVERTEPFADNIKPVTRFVSWLVRSHPRVALHFVFHHGAYMLKKMARAWRRVPEVAYARWQQQHRNELRRLAAEHGIAEETLAVVDAQRAPNILKEPYGRWRVYGWLTRHSWLPLGLAVVVLGVMVAAAALVAYQLALPIVPQAVRSALSELRSVVSGFAPVRFAWYALRWVAFITFALASGAWVRSLLRSFKPPDFGYLARQAKRIRETLGVRYVVMGHTHDADLLGMGNGEYFNTGTWTKVFSEEERLLRDENELVFVRVLRGPGGPKLKLLKWIDGANEPRLVKLASDRMAKTDVGA